MGIIRRMFLAALAEIWKAKRPTTTPIVIPDLCIICRGAIFVRLDRTDWACADSTCHASIGARKMLSMLEKEIHARGLVDPDAARGN